MSNRSVRATNVLLTNHHPNQVPRPLTVSEVYQAMYDLVLKGHRDDQICMHVDGKTWFGPVYFLGVAYQDGKAEIWISDSSKDNTK